MKPDQHCSCNRRQKSLESSTQRTLPSIGSRVVRTSHCRAPAFRRPVQGVTLDIGIGGMMCSNPRVKRRRAKQAKTRQPCRPLPCRAANLGLFLDQRRTEELVPRERPLVTFAPRFLRTVRGQVPVLYRAGRPGVPNLNMTTATANSSLGIPRWRGWVDVIDIRIFHSPTDNGPWALSLGSPR